MKGEKLEKTEMWKDDVTKETWLNEIARGLVANLELENKEFMMKFIPHVLNDFILADEKQSDYGSENLKINGEVGLVRRLQDKLLQVGFKRLLLWLSQSQSQFQPDSQHRAHQKRCLIDRRPK